MNLILKPGLNATWERFGLFCIRDPKMPSNDRRTSQAARTLPVLGWLEEQAQCTW